jgi:apolipoprotein D and lipocalin family protein
MIFKKVAVVLSVLFSALSGKAQDVQTVKHVDLEKYLGKWYEIASYPQWFQKGCNCTTANYSLSNKGYIIVENRCNKDSVNGKLSYAKGRAFVQPNSGNAKLRVQFFWPFRGSYWIIELAPNYSYAVVSDPSKKYLWILSRTAKMEQKTYHEITTRLLEKGYDLSKLKLTKQI